MMKRQKKADVVYKQLIDRIATMNDGEEFPSVRQLMEEFSVSQFSVQPAILKLQQQGVLHSVVGRGTFVYRSRMPRQKRFVLLTPDWPHYGSAEFDRLFVMEANRRNHQVKLVTYNFDADVYSMLPLYSQYDAILLEPLRIDEFSADQLQAILDSPAPVIICRAEIPLAGINYVAGNATMSGVAAANYLDRMGHRRIGLLWSEPHNRTCCDLVSGFRTYAKLNELKVELLDCHTNYGENSLDNARQILQGYLAKKRLLPFSALFVISDETAVAALDTLESEGFCVPQDISVIGFGNVEIPGRYHGRLTSVGHPLASGVFGAMNMAETLARGEELSEPQIKIAPEVFERFTVKPLAAPRFFSQLINDGAIK